METLQKDTVVSAGEVFIKSPVQYVGDVWSERMSSTCVNHLFRHLPISHMSTLYMNTHQTHVSINIMMSKPFKHQFNTHTCKMFNDLLMSPVERVTMAFMPSGVMSMLSVKKAGTKPILNIYECMLGIDIVWFYWFKVVSAWQSWEKTECLCVKGFLLMKCAAGFGHSTHRLLCSGFLEWIHLMIHVRYDPQCSSKHQMALKQQFV